MVRLMRIDLTICGSKYLASKACARVWRLDPYLTFPFVLSWSTLEAMAAGYLVVGSKTTPVEEMIKDGENVLLVDFLSTSEISQRVIDVLAAGCDGCADIRQNTRLTIVKQYGLITICLPAQFLLPENAMNK